MRTVLRAARRRARISQQALAAAAMRIDPGCRLSQSRISEFERGITVPSYRQLIAIDRTFTASGVKVSTPLRSGWEKVQLDAAANAATA